MRPALEARNLVKHYPDVVAVDDVSLSVSEGICFGLLGPNGAGKTTTVEIIEGVTAATSGEVWSSRPLTISARSFGGNFSQGPLSLESSAAIPSVISEAIAIRLSFLVRAYR